jgi:histidinol-phosphate aminotransferase
MEVGPEAKEICDELLHLGVIVRPLGWMGFPEAIRISVGTTEENGKCLAAMAEILTKRAGKGELAAR